MLKVATRADKNSNQIENVSGADDILNMWRDHFKLLFNYVQDVTDRPGVLSYIQTDTPSEFLPDSNTVYTSGVTRIFSQSHPLPLINKHKHPFGLKNPKFQCFF